MELVLRYRGELPPTKDKEKHILLKHMIRQTFHRQLIYHWQRARFLREQYPTEDRLAKMPTAKDAERKNWFKGVVGKFQFVPLVVNSKYFQLVCELDIRFARRAALGDIMQGGDLDNRIKTLFDALRMPVLHSAQELPKGAEPIDGETPFFCLLEDDRLITKFSVASEHLLDAPLEGEKETDVLLTIDAKIKLNPFADQSAFAESFPN